MKVVKKVNGWGTLLGAIGVAALALGLSLKLEGAPPSSRPEQPQIKVPSAAAQQKAAATVEGLSSSPTPADAPQESTSRVTTGMIPASGMEVIATIHVDWRDDEGTRLRQAGKLIGPMPFVGELGGVATGGCSFNIDCDDANRCTIDTCNIPPGGPLLAGKCEYNPVPEGANLALGGCSDGNFCNGLEACRNLVCHGGAC